MRYNQLVKLNSLSDKAMQLLSSIMPILDSVEISTISNTALQSLSSIIPQITSLEISAISESVVTSLRDLINYYLEVVQSYANLNYLRVDAASINENYTMLAITISQLWSSTSVTPINPLVVLYAWNGATLDLIGSSTASSSGDSTSTKYWLMANGMKSNQFTWWTSVTSSQFQATSGTVTSYVEFCFYLAGYRIIIGNKESGATTGRIYPLYIPIYPS